MGQDGTVHTRNDPTILKEVGIVEFALNDLGRLKGLPVEHIRTIDNDVTDFAVLKTPSGNNVALMCEYEYVGGSQRPAPMTSLFVSAALESSQHRAVFNEVLGMLGITSRIKDKPIKMWPLDRAQREGDRIDFAAFRSISIEDIQANLTRTQSPTRPPIDVAKRPAMRPAPFIELAA